MANRRCFAGVRKSSSGQAPILALAFFFLIVPTSIIVAENVTVNLTGDFIGDVSLNNALEPSNISLNDSINSQAIPLPQLTGTLDIPDKVVRNNPFSASVSIFNNDVTDAEIRITWLLPSGFSIISGNASLTTDIPAGSAFSSDLVMIPALSRSLGTEQISVEVTYE